jgi:uncharacterized protein YbaP (TraB family)
MNAAVAQGFAYVVFATAALVTLLSASTSHASHSEHPVFEIVHERNRLYLVGVAHFSAHPPEKRVAWLQRYLRGASAVAIESIVDSASREAGKSVFTTTNVAETYASLPPQLQLCVSDALSSDRRISRSTADILKRQHVASLLLTLGQHMSLAPQIRTYVGTDRIALAIAAEQNIPVIGLESAHTQLRAYRDLPLPVIFKSLEVYCKILGTPTLRTQYASFSNVLLLRYSETRDVIGARKAVEDFYSSAGLVEFVFGVTDSRNFALAESIFALLKSKSCSLVFVGGAHLAGPTALPKLLEAHGANIREKSVQDNSPCTEN